MQHNTIIFQLATHYLPKVALRLERLFFAIELACKEVSPITHHYALKNIIEIIKLVEKPELKSRFVKELMRIEHVLNKSQTTITDLHYAKIFAQVQVLNHIAGRFGESIHSNVFLQSIRVAQSAHDSDCELHAPQLLLWLENDPVFRQRDLIQWLKYLQPLYDTVTIYLSLLRDTAVFESINMANGFYQSPLPLKTSCHLILLRMDKNAGVVPQMQLGHHGLSLRLCDAYTMQDIHQSNAAIDLAICRL